MSCNRIFRRGVSAEGIFETILILLLCAPGLARGADPTTDVDPPVRSVGDVAVTATRADRALLDTAGNVTVIDREAIESSGAANVVELLRREAGLFVTNSTSSRIGYTVEPRGFNNGSGGGSGVLVLMDGRRLNEPATSTPDWALLHLDDIERIEVVRGPASALWGDNAVGGVIQIITRDGTGGDRATATVRLGRYQTQEGSLSAGGSAGPVALSIFADRFRSDGYRDQSLFRVGTLKGNLTTQLGDRASLVLRGGWSTDDRDSPGPLEPDEIDDDRQQVDPDNTGNRGHIRSRYVDGVLEWTPIDGLHAELQGSWTQRSDRAFSASEFGVFDEDFTSKAIAANARVQVDREIAGRAYRLVAGVDLLREMRTGGDAFDDFFYDPGDTETDRRTRRNLLGAWLQHELEVLPGLLVTGGVRHDRAEYRIVEIDRTGMAPKVDLSPTHSVWSPKVGLVYRVSETTSGYVSYSRGFRMPNLAETSSVLFDNPDVGPQRSRSTEIGVKHRSERFRGNVALYRMDVKDEIILNSEVTRELFGALYRSPISVNVDRVRHQGLEASWSADLLSWLELHGGYTWDDTRIKRDDLTDLDGRRVPLTPEHRGQLGLLAQLPAWLEVGLDVHLVGRRYVVNDFSHEFDKLPAFRRWDLHLAWKPPVHENVELSFFFDMQNLLRRNYAEAGGRPTFPQVDPPPVPPTVVRLFPAPERLWTGGVSVTVRR